MWESLGEYAQEWPKIGKLGGVKNDRAGMGDIPSRRVHVCLYVYGWV